VLRRKLPELRARCSARFQVPPGGAPTAAPGQAPPASGAASADAGPSDPPAGPSAQPDAPSARLAAQAGVYAAAARSAAAVGARSGPLAVAAFACNGRGKALYGALGREAQLLDEAFGGRLPFAGMFCGGEVGPRVHGGRAGWSEQRRSDDGLSFGGKGAVFQGYTSMFAAFGAGLLE